MAGLGAHAGFIIASYAIAAAVLASLVLWVVLDYRAQTRRIAELEARGVRRRSAARTGSEAGPGP
jgi:heme exporter protein D